LLRVSVACYLLGYGVDLLFMIVGIRSVIVMFGANIFAAATAVYLYYVKYKLAPTAQEILVASVLVALLISMVSMIEVSPLLVAGAYSQALGGVFLSLVAQLTLFIAVFVGASNGLRRYVGRKNRTVGGGQ
jgi:hypothetical protein